MFKIFSTDICWINIKWGILEGNFTPVPYIGRKVPKGLCFYSGLKLMNSGSTKSPWWSNFRPLGQKKSNIALDFQGQTNSNTMSQTSTWQADSGLNNLDSLCLYLLRNPMFIGAFSRNHLWSLPVIRSVQYMYHVHHVHLLKDLL
jgi:hypothetical protein